MRVLLDTHTFIWLTSAPERVGKALPILEDPSTDLLLSAASAWEIAIKYGLGRLELPEAPRTWVTSRAAEIGAELISVRHGEALAVAELPMVHRDPFDRLLAVQSRARDARIATGDLLFARYDVDCLWLG